MTEFFEIKDILDIVIKNEQKLEQSKLITFLSEFCEKNNIRVTKETDLTTASTKRIILSGNVSNAGTVIDAQSWKVLAMPPPQPNPKFSRKYVNQIIADHSREYEVLKIIDGTIATLYYYNNAWCISTVNGYDVSNITWIGSKTFSELVMESLLENKKFTKATGLSDKLDSAGRLQFSKLSTDYYYTIGFRHENIHPPHANMKCPKRVAWFVDSNANVRNDKVEQCLVNGHRIKCNLIEYLPTQSVINMDGIKSIDELFVKAPSEYGYIIRNTTDGNRKGRSYLIESALTKNLKKFIYDIPKINGLDSSNRLLFTIVRAFLGNHKEKFIELFPQFLSEYKKCNMIYRSVCNTIVNLACGEDVNNRYSELATIIYKKMRKIDAINSRRQNWDIINNFIGQEYTLLFMDIYCSKFSRTQ